ncbi:IS701 family transposase [Streptomyces achromogenes]
MSSSETRMATSDGPRIQRFVEDIFRSLHRVEQHRWARAYLRALLQGSGKKTPRRMAQEDFLPTAAMRGLHQFINASSWDWRPVRRGLARRVAATASPYAWTVAELVIPKNGEHSVGVHRRVDPATRQTVNCQRALGLFLAGAQGAFPVDWSLVLSGPWDGDPERRRRARIPEGEKERPVGAYVLDYAADAVTLPHGAGLPWVLDLTRCDDAAGVLTGLARERLDVLAEVDPGQVVLAGQHTPTVRTVGGLMGVRHARQPHVMMRQAPDGRTKAVTIHTYTGTVRLPQLAGADGGSRAYRILERPALDGRLPARYWLTSLTDRPVDEVLSLVRGRTAALSAVSVLQNRLGVLDFEGRSFPGWHHHMTMASAAYAYQYLDDDPGHPLDPPPAARAAEPSRAGAS